jgi:hypothetical protein
MSDPNGIQGTFGTLPALAINNLNGDRKNLP